MICIAENNGEGGVSGGAGNNGQASQNATGSAAQGYGWPVIECVTHTPCDLLVQLTRDYDGNVQSDLSGITSVRFVARPSMTSTSDTISTACTFTQDGAVTVPLTDAMLSRQGIYYAEFQCSDSTGKVRQNYRAYLCVRKGIDDITDGPRTVTVMDVRLALMDTSPSANQLLDDLEFSDMQILHAVQRCIDEFNELPPEISRKFTAADFPWPENLTTGAVGVLMQEIAYRFTRNRMQYSASGFNLDTSDKGPVYIQLAAQARGEWKQFMATKKTELNMQDCFGTIDIPYFGGTTW